MFRLILQDTGYLNTSLKIQIGKKKKNQKCSTTYFFLSFSNSKLHSFCSLNCIHQNQQLDPKPTQFAQLQFLAKSFSGFSGETLLCFALFLLSSLIWHTEYLQVYQQLTSFPTCTFWQSPLTPTAKSLLQIQPCRLHSCITPYIAVISQSTGPCSRWYLFMQLKFFLQS